MGFHHSKLIMAAQLSMVFIEIFLARPTYSRHTESLRVVNDRHNNQAIGYTPVEGYGNSINDIAELSKLFQEALKQQRVTNTGYREHKRRAKRHGHHSKTIVEQTRTLKSCPVKSVITNLKEAVDMFGNTVAVYPSVHIGKIAVNQYFHETFCDKEACQCGGVDGIRYHSSCETNYSFTYARVVQHGEIGWTKILVRSGCSCVLRKTKSLKRRGNIMDSI